MGCGKGKIWDKFPEIGPVKAKDIYTGTFSKKCVEYAEKFHPDSWRILSAKYGFMEGNDIILTPYNACFHIKNSNPISFEELRDQAEDKELNKYDKIVVLGGRYYTNLIKSVFPNKYVYNPLENCKGIGYMIRKLNNLLNH